jgi:hypothetical protein
MLACGLLTTIYLQEALWFHIQLFGKLLQKGAIIGPTPPDVHDHFNRFFNCLEDITATHNNTTTTVQHLDLSTTVLTFYKLSWHPFHPIVPFA